MPRLAGKEREYVLDCLDTNWISSIGEYITKFETEFAKFCGTKHAIATNNGTTALHLALVALGVKPGDEVIIPTVTYIATANAVQYCGATPVLVDCEPGTFNIDPARIAEKITSRTVGIIPVHLYGLPADMKTILEIAKANSLWVLEDAAEAHGAKIDGKVVGSWGNCATFSFFGNKIITTGEGGMVTTDDDELASRLRLYKGQGMDPERRYWFPVVGFNYRMTNIQAAIGLAQLENIDEALTYRQRLANWYDRALSNLDSLILPVTSPSMTHSFWMYTISVTEDSIVSRDLLMAKLAERGIETRPVFYPMHVLPPYLETSTYPMADSWSSRGINLPTHQGVSEEHVMFIADAIREIFQELA